MKSSEVPQAAYEAAPVRIPTREVPDWDALYHIMAKRGFIVIEGREIRATNIGGEESVLVKTFNNYVRNVKNMKLRTRRLSKYRWVCTL